VWTPGGHHILLTTNIIPSLYGQPSCTLYAPPGSTTGQSSSGRRKFCVLILKSEIFRSIEVVLRCKMSDPEAESAEAHQERRRNGNSGYPHKNLMLRQARAITEGVLKLSGYADLENAEQSLLRHSSKMRRAAPGFPVLTDSVLVVVGHALQVLTELCDVDLDVVVPLVAGP